MTVLSIHQPNFIPWVPFFEKIHQSDIFVVLGHCQFEKNNYQNRFMYDGKWMTIPVVKGNMLIKDKTYIYPRTNWVKIKDKIKKPNITNAFDNDFSTSLMGTNLSIILKITYEFLHLKTKTLPDYPTTLTGTDRLVDICKRYKADTYLSGPSGKTYLDMRKFEEAGIKVEFFEAHCKMDIITYLDKE